MTEGEVPQTPIEGPEEEAWASWLVENKGEVEGIKDDTLRTEIRLLARRPYSMVTPEVLLGAYDRIDKLVIDGKVKDGDVALWQGRIAERHQHLTSSMEGAEFTPESFARAMGQASPEEQKSLYLKAEETIGAPIQMQLEVPKFLLDPHLSIEERETAQREWRARGQLVTMAYNKRIAPSYDKLYPNQEAIDFSREQLETLLSKPGVIEATSLHLINIVGTKTDDAYSVKPKWYPRDISDYEIPNPLYVPGSKDKKKKYKYIKSVFNITSGEQFALYRAKVRGFLEQRGLGIEQAREAEQIGWNLLYSSNVFEEYDKGGIPPLVPQLKSQAVWMMMHPQKRLVNKVGSPEKEEKDGKIPEAWGTFGEWAVNKTKTTGEELSDDILPELLFKNALRKIEFESIKDKTLFAFLFENGKNLAKNPKGATIKAKDLPWGDVEAPFGAYYFETISPAIKVFEVIAKGPSKESNLVELGNALRKLGVEDLKYRENLLMAWVGIKSRSEKLTPAMGWTDWGIFKNELKKYAPNFFK